MLVQSMLVVASIYQLMLIGLCDPISLIEPFTNNIFVHSCGKKKTMIR
jgi:hypothetical protein